MLWKLFVTERGGINAKIIKDTEDVLAGLGGGGGKEESKRREGEE